MVIVPTVGTENALGVVGAELLTSATIGEGNMVELEREMRGEVCIALGDKGDAPRNPNHDSDFCWGLAVGSITTAHGDTNGTPEDTAASKSRRESGDALAGVGEPRWGWGKGE